MKENVSFTVITPVYNREDCIGRCIESVAGQNYPLLEYWIVDDGSKDATCSIIEAYAEKYPFIRFHKFEKNRGVNAARNYAIQHSTGDFIIFLDSDDLFRLNALNAVCETMESRPGYPHYLFEVNDRINYYKKNPLLNREEGETSEVYFTDFLTGRVSGDFAHVMSRSVLQKFPFDEKLPIYVYTNFLKIYKAEKRQVYVRKIIIMRERNRSDSVTRTGRLDNLKALNSQYLAMKEVFYMFIDDFSWGGMKDNQTDHAKRMYLLGTALGLYEENRFLEAFALEREIQIPPSYLKLSRLKLGYFLRIAIFAYSIIKNKLKKSE